MRIYKSKIGYEVLIILVLIFLIIFGVSYYQGASYKNQLFNIGLAVLILGFVIYLNFATEYIISETKLITKCGIFYKKELNILEIKSISNTKVLISSPAPSLNRIELIYGKYDVLIISPKNKVEFSNELKKINPDIQNNVV